MPSNKAILHIIPTVISEDALTSIPKETIDIIHRVKFYIVERARTARRFIKSTNPPYRIEELQIIELDKEDHSISSEIKKWFSSGYEIGLLSESGMPSVADPGSQAVRIAHEFDLKVIPHVGPSSIILSLAASGLNGQHFCFHGYLPIKNNELVRKLKQLEDQIKRSKATQIFIETPYRNDRMLKSLLSNLSNNTILAIARDITGSNELIISKPVSWWKKNSRIEIGKHPCIFLIG